MPLPAPDSLNPFGDKPATDFDLKNLKIDASNPFGDKYVDEAPQGPQGDPLTRMERVKYGANVMLNGAEQAGLQFEDWVGRPKHGTGLVDPRTGQPTNQTWMDQPGGRRMLGDMPQDPSSEQFTAAHQPYYDDYQKRYFGRGYGWDVPMLGHIDPYETLGGAATAAPLMALGPEGLSVGALAGSGAIGGGITGALQYDPENKGINRLIGGAKGAVAGAITAPIVGKVIQYTAKGLAAATDRLTGAFGAPPPMVDDLTRIIPDFEELPRTAQAELLRDAQGQDLATGNFNAEQLQRKANILRHGGRATQAMVTRDAGDWTQERNWVKAGQNSSNKVEQSVARDVGSIYESNNSAFIESLDKGTSRIAPATTEQAGTRALAVINDVAEESQKGVSKVYRDIDVATGGRPIWAPQETLTALTDPDVTLHPDTGPKIATPAMGWLEKAGVVDKDGAPTGKVLTATETNNFRKFVNSLPNVFGKRNILKAIDEDSLNGLSGVDDYQPARAAAKARFDAMHSPAIDQAVNAWGELRQGKVSQNFIRQQIVGAPVQDVQSLVSGIKTLGTRQQRMDFAQSVRSGIVSWLKSEAIDNQRNIFGAYHYNNALETLGDERLSMFFTKGEISHLKSLGEAAHDAITEPFNASVNHSNSGVAAIGMSGLGKTAKAARDAMPQILSQLLPKSVMQIPESSTAKVVGRHIISANGIPMRTPPNPKLLRLGTALSSAAGPVVGAQAGQPGKQ